MIPAQQNISVLSFVNYKSLHTLFKIGFMAEQSNSGAWVVIGVVGGIVVGSLFTYFVFKSREQPPSIQHAQTSTMHSIDVDALRQMWAEMQNLSKHVLSLSEENSALKIQLAAARDIRPQTVEAPKPQTPLTTTTAYKNNEKRVYERGKDGFIKSINIIRDAKVNAAG